MFRQITSLPPVQKKFRQPEPLKKVQEFVLIVQITDRQQTGMMIINITYFSWCDSHFQGLAKRGEPSEQKCNTSIWSEAQTKVKLKILFLIAVCIAGRAQANVQLNILIPMHSRPLLRGVGHLLHMYYSSFCRSTQRKLSGWFTYYQKLSLLLLITV